MFNVKEFNNKLEYIKENLDHSDYKKIRDMERDFVVRYIDTDSVYLNCLSRFLETISIKNDRPIKLNSIDLSIIRFINPEKDKMSIKIYTSSSGYVDANPFLLDSEYRYGYKSGIDLMSYLDKYISCIDKKSDNKPIEPCLSSIEESNSKQKSDVKLEMRPKDVEEIKHKLKYLVEYMDYIDISKSREREHKCVIRYDNKGEEEIQCLKLFIESINLINKKNDNDFEVFNFESLKKDLKFNFENGQKVGIKLYTYVSGLIDVHVYFLEPEYDYTTMYLSRYLDIYISSMLKSVNGVPIKPYIPYVEVLEPESKPKVKPKGIVVSKRLKEISDEEIYNHLRNFKYTDEQKKVIYKYILEVGSVKVKRANIESLIRLINYFDGFTKEQDDDIVNRILGYVDSYKRKKVFICDFEPTDNSSFEAPVMSFDGSRDASDDKNCEDMLWDIRYFVDPESCEIKVDKDLNDKIDIILNHKFTDDELVALYGMCQYTSVISISKEYCRKLVSINERLNGKVKNDNFRKLLDNFLERNSENLFMADIEDPKDSGGFYLNIIKEKDSSKLAKITTFEEFVSNIVSTINTSPSIDKNLEVLLNRDYTEKELDALCITFQTTEYITIPRKYLHKTITLFRKLDNTAIYSDMIKAIDRLLESKDDLFVGRIKSSIGYPGRFPIRIGQIDNESKDLKTLEGLISDVMDIINFQKETETVNEETEQETSSETNNSILNNSNSEIMTTKENKAAKTVKGGMNGMMNKMMETMKSRFMPELVEGVKVSFDGLLCIHTKDGWVASNNNNELVSYPDEMVFEGFPVYSITRQIDQLMVGDIIVSGKGYSKVLGATKDGKLKTLSYSGYNRTEVPIKDFVFGKSVKVLMNMLPQMKAMGFDPMMMGMMNGELDFESLMMFQVMGGSGMNFGGGSNPMSMMAIMSMMGSKGEGEDKGGMAGMMEMMMMSSMFGGGGANPFGAMFGGGDNPNVNVNPNPQEGMANAFANMMGGFTGEGGTPVFQKANVPVAGDEPKAGPKVIATFDPEDENEDQK